MQEKESNINHATIKPFIDVIDLNESSKEIVNDVKPKPAVVIGIKS